MGESSTAPIHIKEELNAYSKSCEKITRLENSLSVYMEAHKGTYNTLKRVVLLRKKQIRILAHRRDKRWNRLIRKGICTVIIPLKKTLYD